MKVGTVSVNAVIDDWKIDREYEHDIDPETLKKWGNDDASRMITDEQLVHNIALLNVRDYRAELPINFSFVNQVAFALNRKDCCTREQVVEWTKQASNGCKVNISLDCPECGVNDCECSNPIVKVDVNEVWKSANPQATAAYLSFFYGYGGTTQRDGRNCWVMPQFKLMRPSPNTFFSIPYYVDGCTASVDNMAEYKVVPPNIITNFKEGQLLLSYMGTDIDDEGWLYIPNLPEVFEAISFGIDEKLARRAYGKKKDSANRAYWMDMRQMKERAIARAKSKLQIPDADEWMVLMRNHFNKLKPYWQYEANFDRYEADGFKMPHETYNWNR